MSDYLNNLAARSAGRAEQFRPRLPSLFEPASGRAGSLSLPRYELEDAGVDQVEDVEGSANQGVRRSYRPARDGPPDGVMVGPQDPEVLGEPDSFQQSRIRVTSAAHQSLKREEPDEDAQSESRQREDQVKVGTARPRDLSDRSQTLLEERPDPTASGWAETANARRNRSGLSPRTPMLDPVLNDRRPADWNTQAKAASSKVADQASVDERQSPIQALFRPRHSITELETADYKPVARGRGPAILAYDEDAGSSERRVESPGPPTAQPASTIKVTIGRVEVRAIVNDSQPRRPESVKASPKVTLDEYLKQRNGGQR